MRDIWSLSRPARLILVPILVVLNLLVPISAGQTMRSPELNLDYHRAEVAWKSGGSVLEAKARVDRVLTAIPDDIEALKLRSQVLMSLKKPAAALMDARKAVALEASDGEAQLILAEVAYAAGKPELALTALGRASESARVVNDARSNVRLSWLAAELDRLGWAEAFARTALALDGRDAATYYQLARVFIMQEKRDEAAEILARGLRDSLISAGVVARDPALAPLLQHPLLSTYSR